MMNHGLRAQAARCAAFSCLWSVLCATTVQAQTPPMWSVMPASVLPVRLPVAAQAYQTDWSLATEAANFQAADINPVRSLDGEWKRYQPRSGRNAALQSARIEAVASFRGWELAATARADILIEGNRAAFDIVHTYQQKLTPAEGSQYLAQARERGVIWGGVRAARTWELGDRVDRLQFTTAVTTLSLRRVQLLDLDGQLRYSQSGGYAIDANVRQQDSRRQFSGFGTPHAIGDGLTSDFGLMWQPDERLFVNLSAVDALSHLRMDGVATELTRASSSTKSVDANGFVEYKPLVSGRDSAQRISLRATQKWSISSGWRITAEPDAPTLGARWERVGFVDVPTIWLDAPLFWGLAAQLDAESRFKSVGLGLRSRHWSLRLRSDSTDARTAKALGWQASASFAF